MSRIILCGSLLFLWFTPAFALEVYEAEYTGNATANRDIAHGLSGAPDYCVIGDAGTQDTIFKTSDANFTTDTTLSWRENAASGTQGIESLGATNVRIDTDSHVNGSGVDYSIVCVKCAGDGDCEAGTYEGTGGDDRDITLSTVTAVQWIGIKNFDSTDSGAHKFKVDATTNASLAFHEFGDTRSNEIQDLGTNTFQVGTGHEVNASAETYVYVAFGTDDGVCQGSYEANNTDDRDITACGFDPEAVFVKSEFDAGASYAVHASDGMPADETTNYSFSANAANLIQETDIGTSDGFQVGTGEAVNTCVGSCTGDDVFYIGFRDTPAAAAEEIVDEGIIWFTED